MKKFGLLSCAAFVGMACVQQANARDVLARIKDTGVVTVGVRDSAAPLSYTVGANEYAGYHVELCQRILAAIQREQQWPKLETKYQVVNSVNRGPLVQNGTVDMECGATTNNEARQKDVAFALTTYVTEIRMVVRADSGITSMAHLKGRNVATTAGSTGGRALRNHVKATGLEVKEIVGKDHGESFLMLQAGRADAFVIDDNVGAGNIATAKKPADYRLAGEVLAIEPIAIMLPKEDPKFKKAVDDQIRRMAASGDLQKLYDKWFMKPIPPQNVAVNLPMGSALKSLIAQPDDKPAEAYAK